MNPRSFLDRFARKPEPSAELSAAIGDLDRLGRDRPEMAGPSRTLSGLLVAAFLRPDESPVTPNEPDAVDGGWRAGVPAFRTRPPALDAAGLVNRARSMAESLGDDPSAGALRAGLRDRRIDLPDLAVEVFHGRPERIHGAAGSAGVPPDLLASILRLALLPALARWSAAYDRTRPEGIWNRGDCPCCGSRLLLAESRGLEQRIAYRCGLCASDWAGERLRCPSCGENRSRVLRYSFIEGEEDRFRLGACDSCGDRWKVVATLGPLSPPGLMVADLASFHLDVLAGETEAGHSA